MSSLRRVGDLQALSVAPSYLNFDPGLAKAFLYPHAGYAPKVPSSTPRPVVLQAFCPPPFREPDQKRLNCMCPVVALDVYVHRAALWRRTDWLLECYGPPKRGLPASKRTLSRRRSSSWRGTSQVTYVSMVPRGNKTLRCRAILPASLLELCFIPRSWRRLHLTCFYASWSWRQLHLTSRHQFEWLHIWFRAWYRWRRSPRVFQRSILFLWETTLHT